MMDRPPRKRERRERRGEAYWRAHHEAWKRSDLNQREYCEVNDLSLKAFGTWRCIFMREPAPPQPKLLYRRGGLSPRLNPTLNPSLSPTLNPGAYPVSPLIVPPPRDGHRRRFSEEERRRIVAEAEQPGATLSEVARRYGVDLRLLRRWKQDCAPPVFASVEIVDEGAGQ